MNNDCCLFDILYLFDNKLCQTDTLILYFSFFPCIDTKVSAKELMLSWMQAFMPSYPINNFTSDWTNGRALLSLIHEIKPDKAPSVSTLDPRKNLSNCNLAIRTAKIYLKVPPIISAEDLASGELDELSMMTYLSYYVKPAAKTVLKWVRETIPHVKINNLTSDWNSGVALAALLNTQFPGLFPKWKSLPRDKPEDNIQKVFDIAKETCGIEPNLSAKDMADPNIEELHVMTYILRIRCANLLSLPEHVDITGPGIHDAKLGRETHFLINSTKAGAGSISVQGMYQDNTNIKFSLKEKHPGILKLDYAPEKPGKIQFHILWSDTPIPGSPFSVSVVDTSLVRVLNRDILLTTIHVQTHVQLKLDATAVGSGTLTVRLIYADQPPVSPEVTNDNNIYTIQFVPVNVGTPTLRFYWNKEELENCTIQYIVLDTRQYCLSGLPKSKTFRTFESIMFNVESRDGLPLHHLQLTAICDDIHIPFEFQNIHQNRGQAVFLPTLPGVYQIEVSCIERLVEGSPFQVTVVDPSKCFFLTKPPKFMAIDIPFDFVLSIKDAGPGEVDLTCIDNPDAFDSDITIDETKFTANIKVTPKKLGEFLISFFHCKGEIPGCPIRLTVCNPNQCTLSNDILHNKKALVGKPVSFSVTNPNWMGLKPVIKVHGPTAQYPVTIEEQSRQEYAVHFTPWEIGDHEVSVMLGGYPIPNSPCHFTGISGESGICSPSGSGLLQALTGIPAQFIVLANSGLLEEGLLDIQVQSVVHGTLGKVRVRDNQNGSYNVAYLVHSPGAYLIHIKAWNKHIPGSPFKVNIKQGPQATECKMYGPALQSTSMIKIGDPIEFSIDTRTAGSGKLSVDAVGPRGVQARVFIARGETPGIHDIQLDPIRPGKYRISAKWSGKHIPGSPFFIKVFPGANASKCKAYGPGLQDGLVGHNTNFTIETQDAGSGVLKVRLNGIKDAFKVEVRPVSSQDVRTLIANYYPTKPGDYLITIKWSDKDIPGSPFKVYIGGNPVEDNGYLLATPRAVDLGIIPEEYEESESHTSLTNHGDSPTRGPKQQTNGYQHDSSALYGEIPNFQYSRGINYRNNFGINRSRGPNKQKPTRNIQRAPFMPVAKSAKKIHQESSGQKKKKKKGS